MLRFLLDTDICIYTIRDRPTHMRERFNAEAPYLAISTVTLSELIYGAEKSDRRTENLRTVEAFAARLSVLDYGEKASAHYGDIRANLERAGTPIGAYDMMIAAHARSEGLVLVTNNAREFDRVAGLRVENWAAG
jgi:tRNA(fMet)-specific endonuclease VapC